MVIVRLIDENRIVAKIPTREEMIKEIKKETCEYTREATVYIPNNNLKIYENILNFSLLHFLNEKKAKDTREILKKCVKKFREKNGGTTEASDIALSLYDLTLQHPHARWQIS